MGHVGRPPEPGHCPVCGIRSRSGAGSCPHYVGTVRKRQLIWSRYGADLDLAWDTVRRAYRSSDRAPLVIAALLRSTPSSVPKGVRSVIEDGLRHDDPFFWVDETEQTRVELDDRGIAFSVYHEDPAFLPTILEWMHDAARWIDAVAAQAGEARRFRRAGPRHLA